MEQESNFQKKQEARRRVVEVKSKVLKVLVNEDSNELEIVLALTEIIESIMRGEVDGYATTKK